MVLTWATLIGATACGSSSASTSDGKYLHLAVGTQTASSGCPAAPAGGSTKIVKNEGQLLELAIYPAPGGKALLDTGVGLFQGTSNGNIYSFQGEVVDTVQQPGNESLIVKVDTTFSLTLNGNAVSGTATTETVDSCSGSGCTGFMGSDCSETAQLAGTVLPGIQYITGVGPN